MRILRTKIAKARRCRIKFEFEIKYNRLALYIIKETFYRGFRLKF